MLCGMRVCRITWNFANSQDERSGRRLREMAAKQVTRLHQSTGGDGAARTEMMDDDMVVEEEE